MPGREGTGPQGLGARTGRGFGVCTTSDGSTPVQSGFGRGRGCGYGNGNGGGARGRGQGRRAGRNAAPEMTGPDGAMAALTVQVAELQRSLSELRQQLSKE